MQGIQGFSKTNLSVLYSVAKSYALATVFFVCYSCSSTNKIDNHKFLKRNPEWPEVQVDIKLDKDFFAVTETMDMGITVKITNNNRMTQKILFDLPKSSIGGPWATSARLFNNKANKAVPVPGYEFGISESVTYTHLQLQYKYIELLPGKSIEKKYKLTDILNLKPAKYPLYNGMYSLQIFYYDNPSNIITFVINSFHIKPGSS